MPVPVPAADGVRWPGGDARAVSLSDDLRRRAAFARTAGLRGTGHLLRERLLVSSELVLGLRCDLDRLPPLRPTRVPLTVRRRDGPTFPEFRRALAGATGTAALLLKDRQDMCDAGVRQLFTTETEGGEVAYLHWCVDQSTLPLIQAVHNHRYRPLAPDEVLIEGAYTFAAQRGAGVMSHGLGLLLRVARDGGARRAYSYPAASNTASLRGAAAAGYELDHVRIDRSHFGRRSSDYRPIDDHARALWQAVTGGRTDAPAPADGGAPPAD